MDNEDKRISKYVVKLLAEKLRVFIEDNEKSFKFHNWQVNSTLKNIQKNISGELPERAVHHLHETGTVDEILKFSNETKDTLRLKRVKEYLYEQLDLNLVQKPSTSHGRATFQKSNSFDSLRKSRVFEIKRLIDATVRLLLQSSCVEKKNGLRNINRKLSTAKKLTGYQNIAHCPYASCLYHEHKLSIRKRKCVAPKSKQKKKAVAEKKATKVTPRVMFNRRPEQITIPSMPRSPQKKVFPQRNALTRSHRLTETATQTNSWNINRSENDRYAEYSEDDNVESESSFECKSDTLNDASMITEEIAPEVAAEELLYSDSKYELAPELCKVQANRKLSKDISSVSPQSAYKTSFTDTSNVQQLSNTPQYHAVSSRTSKTSLPTKSTRSKLSPSSFKNSQTNCRKGISEESKSSLASRSSKVISLNVPGDHAQTASLENSSSLNVKKSSKTENAVTSDGDESLTLDGSQHFDENGLKENSGAEKSDKVCLMEKEGDKILLNDDATADETETQMNDQEHPFQEKPQVLPYDNEGNLENKIIINEDSTAITNEAKEDEEAIANKPESPTKRDGSTVNEGESPVDTLKIANIRSKTLTSSENETTYSPCQSSSTSLTDGEASERSSSFKENDNVSAEYSSHWTEEYSMTGESESEVDDEFRRKFADYKRILLEDDEGIAASCEDEISSKNTVENSEDENEESVEKSKTLLDTLSLGNPSMLRKLQSVDENLYELVDEDGWSMLHLAASKGMADFVEKLLHYGLPVDAVTENGLTALEIAIANNHLVCCQVLLRHGASLAKEDEDIEDEIDVKIENAAPSIRTLLQKYKENYIHVQELVDILNRFGGQKEYISSRLPRHLLKLLAELTLEELEDTKN